MFWGLIHVAGSTNLTHLELVRLQLLVYKVAATLILFKLLDGGVLMCIANTFVNSVGASFIFCYIRCSLQLCGTLLQKKLKFGL